MSLILMPYQDLPFNGDIHIQKEFLQLQKKYDLNVAAETGSCLFSTTEWLGKTFSRVFTCENNAQFYGVGLPKIQGMPVRAILNDSVIALDEIAASLKEDDKVIFFLDAHWNEHCPLNEEILKIAGMTHLKQPPVIAIHDWKVPDHPELGFDMYQGKEFTYELIAESMAQVETAFKEKYKYYFNSEATGAMRGIIYLYPEMNAAETLPQPPDKILPPQLFNTPDPALENMLHIAEIENAKQSEQPDELMKQQVIGREDRTEVPPVEIQASAELTQVHMYKIEAGTTIRLFGEPVEIETAVMFKSSSPLWQTVKNKELLTGFSLFTPGGFKKLTEL